MNALVVLLLLLLSSFQAEISASHASVNRYIASEIKKYDVPGVAVAFVIDGQGYLFCYGLADIDQRVPVTPNTLFDIASITKVFTTTDMALQIESGKMFLTDSIAKYLSGISKTSPVAKITLGNLATHTSSLPRGVPRDYDTQKMYDFLDRWQPPYQVGSKYVYSNLGFWLLRYALEEVEQKPYQEILEDELFKPLGMTSTMIIVPQSDQYRYATGYSQNGARAEHRPLGPGGGSLKSTASDMLRFLNLNLGNSGSKKLQEAVLIAQSGQYKVNEHLIMGLGWQRFEKEGLLYIDKNGGVPGFSSYIGIIPSKKIGIVILANKVKVPCTKIGRDILDHFARDTLGQKY